MGDLCIVTNCCYATCFRYWGHPHGKEKQFGWTKQVIIERRATESKHQGTVVSLSDYLFGHMLLACTFHSFLTYET